MEVTFGGHQNLLQRSPLYCPLSAIFIKVYHVGVNMCYCYKHQSTTPTKHPPSLFCIFLFYLHLASLSTLQQSIIHNKSSSLTNNFNLPFLSTSPTCIYLPYQNSNLTSLSPPLPTSTFLQYTI